jgi:glycine C-acetyltransferase
MSLSKIESLFAAKVASLREQGVSKGSEKIITGIKKPAIGFGPRYKLAGHGD